MIRRTSNGFSLFEMVVAGAIAAIVIAAGVRFLPMLPTFVRRIQVQQQIVGESRRAMDTMVQFLRLAKASSVQICSCNDHWCADTSPPCTMTTDDPANSQIDFSTIDGHKRRFYWGGIANRTLLMDDSSTGIAPFSTSILAHNVRSLGFGGNSLDYSIIDISLEFEAPVDSSGSQATVVIMPIQSVRMITSQ